MKYQKCHSLLSDGGYLVLLWNDAQSSADPIVVEAYRRLFRYYPEKANKAKSAMNKNDARKKEIQDSGLFELVAHRNYPWFSLQKKEAFIHGFFSQSSFLSLNREQQATLSHELRELFAGLDDDMQTEEHTSVFIAKKLSQEEMPCTQNKACKRS